MAGEGKCDAVFDNPWVILRMRKLERKSVHGGFLVVLNPLPHKINEYLSLDLSIGIDVGKATFVELDVFRRTPNVTPTLRQNAGSCRLFERQEGDNGGEVGLGQH